jgi:prepilin peptidase CpaA
MPSSNAAVLSVLCAGMCSAAIVDAASRRIPNAICGAIAATGVTFAVTGVSGISPASSLLGLTFGLLLMLPGYIFGGTGAGDVKLFAAAGALLGAGKILSAFLFVAVAGGVLAVGFALHRGRLARTVKQTAQIFGRPSDAKAAIESPREHNRFPYGPAIAAGCMMAALKPLM